MDRLLRASSPVSRPVRASNATDPMPAESSDLSAAWIQSGYRLIDCLMFWILSEFLNVSSTCGGGDLPRTGPAESLGFFHGG